jgi:hypothetical protein
VPSPLSLDGGGDDDDDEIAFVEEFPLGIARSDSSVFLGLVVVVVVLSWRDA